MMLSLLCSLALAAPPEVVASSRKGVLSLSFQAPEGEHINAPGPFSVELMLDDATPLELHGRGQLLSAPLQLPGSYVEGIARVPLCEDEGGSCRVAEVGFRGTAARRPASLNDPSVLAARDPKPPAHGSDLQQAFRKAEAERRLVLIDFGAVWCPPCNLMAAQVFEDPDNAVDLEPFEVVAVDVDTVESWPAKDRYAIGGYPTLVLAKPDGEEVDRFVGYPGEEELLAWLARAPGAASLDLKAATPEQAAAQARRFAAQGSEERARAWLAAAEGVEDTVDFRVARIQLDATAEDARWLLEAGVPITDWLWSALSIEDETLRAPLRAAVAAALAGADAQIASDLSYAAAILAEDEAEQALHYGAAAAALRASLSGDPAQDRGQWTGLASVMARAGDPEGAVAVLEAAVRHYPEEFTFHYSLSLRRSDAGDTAGAVAAAREALAHSYGDNRLRAANVLAKALHAADQTDEALAVLSAALEAAELPEDGLDVRTPRYIEALEKTRSELQAVAAE